ncbi:hypothetical protein [Sphingomonas agri]|uniref:hypothetical protein n=1 Tax=Sphingomonas agri TaxID=1813878 RepID=UPI00312047DF
MQTYRILYYRQSVLEDAEDVQADNLLEVIGKASGKSPHLRAEIWCGEECVGEIGSCPTA